MKVPPALTIYDLQKTLLPRNPAAVIVGSLAPDADSIDSVSYQVATATFEPLDPPFLDLQPGHQMKCTYNDIEGQSRLLIVDCSFFGLTTLASPSSKSDIEMEYVSSICLMILQS